MSEVHGEALPANAGLDTRMFTPIRFSALVMSGVICTIVWMSYSYTGGLIEGGLALIAEGQPDEIKDGVIQLLSAVVQNIVAVTAVGGLIAAVNKLCD